MNPTQAQIVASDYQFHNRLIHHFVGDTTHAESVLQLPFAHNCLNWILGHVVANRSHVLEAVGIDHEWQDSIRKRYHQDTPPVKTSEDGWPLTQLMAHLDESVQFLSGLDEAVDETFMSELFANYRGEKGRFEHAQSFHWHETFHIGQLEILRSFIESQRGS